jgi:GAF domain-containing protein
MTDGSSERDARLAQQFVTLADTLVDDYDIVDLLDQLVHSAVSLLPVEHAGLLLLDARGEPQLLAATGESPRLLELFQLQTDEGGPCLECLRTGSPVRVADLATEGQRWPQFSRTATDLGFAAVHALPLRLRKQVIGALNLFGSRPGLADEDLAVGQSLADMATIGILQQRTTEAARLEAEQLQQALTTRVVIEQAKGALGEFGAVDMQGAFDAMRAHARTHHLKLGELAEALVTRRLDPSMVLPPGGRLPGELL